MRRAVMVGLLLCLLLGFGSGAGAAQEGEDLWSEPVNLSRSGAAETPSVVAGPDGRLQVFWWDRFDGVATAYTTEEGWSAPTMAPIETAEIFGEGENAEVVYTSIAAMPEITGAGEVALAWWLGPPERETGLRPLMLSRIRLGTAGWTAPEEMAESALTWEVAQDPNGVLHLAYVRVTHSNAFPAGIYYKRSADGGASWSAPVVLHASTYARLWTEETAHLSVAADGLGNVLVGWDDPRQERALYVASSDNGGSWSEPVTLGDAESGARRPRFAVGLVEAPAEGSEDPPRSERLALWEAGRATTACSLYQQPFTEEGLAEAEPVLEGVNACSQGASFHRTPGGQLLLITGGGSGGLTLAAWDGEREEWSEPKGLGFSFEAPETERQIYLDGLDAALAGETLVVVGAGQGGDVWFLQGQTEALDFAFAPASPWSEPAPLSGDLAVAAAGGSAAVVDAEGRLHLLWSTGEGLAYARWDPANGSWSRPAPLFEGGREPALVAVGDRLHAVWSGDGAGEILYSRAYTRDAYAAGGWSDPQLLPSFGATGSAPALVAEGDGTLHLLYAVPLNEGRSVTYLRSDDGGERWSEPVVVFDAEAEGWSLVDHPALAYDAEGVLHAAWVRGSSDGPFPPEALYYARSLDGGESWSEAQIMGEGAYDRPQLVPTSDGGLHLLWADLEAGTWLERSSADYGTTWSYQQQVRGFRDVVGRLGLASDGAGTLHLAALTAGAAGEPTLLYTPRSGESWGELERHDLEGVGDPLDGVLLLALDPEAGRLHVVGGSSRINETGGGEAGALFHLYRSVSASEVAAPESGVPAPPLPTPTPGPTPTPTPTPRPDVAAGAPPAGMPVIEAGPVSLPVLALGGLGLALLIVGAVVVLQIKRR
ncbi:MAG: exo-alpha-sialidase [Anaerolineales bacterium]